MSLLGMTFRYLRTRRVALVAIFAIALGVMAMIVTTALMDGVQRFLRDHFKGTNADIRVEHASARSGLVGHWAKIEDVLEQELEENGGEIVAMSPRMITPALALPGDRPRPELEDRTRGILLVGIDFDLEREVTPFGELFARVVEDGLRVPAAQRGDPLEPVGGVPSIILGDTLANELGVSRALEGGMVTLLTGDFEEGERELGDRRSGVFRVVGCFSTGRADYDKMFAYVDRGALRRLRFADPERNLDANAAHLRIADSERASALAWDLAGRHPGLECRSWQDVNRAELLSIQDQKKIILVILFSTVIIASAAILGIVYSMVVEKTKDIGILRSMGLGRHRLVFVFTMYGLVLGVIGASLGVFLGLQLTHGLDGVVGFLSDVTGMRILDPDVYRFKSIPVHVEVPTVLVIFGAALGMSVVAAWVPAWLRIRRWSPVRCLREE